MQVVDISNPTASCSDLQALVVSTFEAAGATLPTNVSVFGNGTVFTADNSTWLPILRNFVPPTPTVRLIFKSSNEYFKIKKGYSFQFVAPNICNGVVRGLSIELSHAKVGYLTNPQASITGVLYRFSEPEQILLQVSRHLTYGFSYHSPKYGKRIYSGCE